MGEYIKNDLAGIAITHPFFADIETNALNYIEELEKENKNMTEKYLVNNPGMAKYLKDNYIFKSKIESKIKVLETLQKEFPNNEELRIKIIAYKELLREE